MDEPIPPTSTSSTAQPSQPASFDSIIIPPEPPPGSPQVSQEKFALHAGAAASGVKFGKKSHTGVIVATLLLFLVTLPLSVIFISNRNQLSDVRSRASEVYPTTQEQCQAAGGACNTESGCQSRGGTEYGTCNTNGARIVCCKLSGPAACPALGGTCSPQGDECDAGDKGRYCCVKSISGSITWQPKTWATCPQGTATCPWTETNGNCCPSSVDACDYTAGGVKCIADPFNSHCEKWGDGTCPGGGGRWAGVHYYTDCTTEGCGKDSSLTCVKNADGKGHNLCRNNSCPSDTDCICNGTPPPTTNTATPTPIPGGQCDAINIYKDGIIVTDLNSLKAGDVIAVWVKGTNATKARVRLNGGAYTEATISDNTNTWYIVPDVTIPSGVSSIVIESEVFVNSQWQ
jgi:hypothetical protein